MVGPLSLRNAEWNLHCRPLADELSRGQNDPAWHKNGWIDARRSMSAVAGIGGAAGLTWVMASVGHRSEAAVARVTGGTTKQPQRVPIDSE